MDDNSVMHWTLDMLLVHTTEAWQWSSLGREVYVGQSVLKELKRIVEDSEVGTTV